MTGINTTTETEWNNLLRNAQKGDITAQNQLCVKLKVRLLPILQCRLRGWQTVDCEDIMQETLTTFIGKIQNIQSNPHMYACTILRNKIGDAIRDQHKSINVAIREDDEADSENTQREASEILSTGETESDYLDRLHKKITVEDILKVIEGLGDFCRMFFLGIFEGESIQDIWQLFQQVEPKLQRSAFDRRTFECRKKIRQMLR